jgi:hypothetical protein
MEPMEPQLAEFKIIPRNISALVSFVNSYKFLALFFLAEIKVAPANYKVR